MNCPRRPSSSGARRVWDRLAALLLPCIVSACILGCSRAADTTAAPISAASAFDGNRAYKLLKQQVELGPRYPGSTGHERGSQFIQSQLKPYADEVRYDDFTYAAGGHSIKLRNILACFNPNAKKWVLLAAHWDTRPRADYEVTAERRGQPIPGANDGASGVAVLLELARVFAKHRPDVGVFMAFFDGEDYGASESEMYLGSKHFASGLPQSAQAAGKNIKLQYGILLDMVGDKNLAVYQEKQSLAAAPEIVEKVWSAAAKLGYGRVFIPDAKYSISDDHVPLIRAGVKCIDVIDFDYAPWHTLDDTPDKCSAASLAIVGEVIARVVYGEAKE